MEANDCESVANTDSRGMNGRIYVGDYYALLHTKHRSCRPQGFREDFKFSPIINLWKLMTPNLDPRGMLGWIYVRDH